MTDNDPSVDGPTVMGPHAGHLSGPVAHDPTDEPTVKNTGQGGHSKPPDTAPAEPTADAGQQTSAADKEPAVPGEAQQAGDEPTLTGTAQQAGAAHDEPTPTGANQQTRAASGEPATADQQARAAIDQPPIAGADQRAATAHDEPTLASAGRQAAADDEATIVGTWQSWPPVDGGPTVSLPRPDDDATITVARPDHDLTAPQSDDEATVSVARPDDEATMAVGAEDVTTTGPTVAGWPFDEPEPPPPAELVWRTDPPPSRPPARKPAYYIALGAAVVLVVGLVAAAAIATVVKPTTSVAGTAVATQGVPEITTTTTAPPPPAPTTAPAPGPLADIAAHPLSTWQGRMADTTCELPRFELPDDRQAAFYTAAKTCADNAWRGVLAEAKLSGDVKLVTVTKPVQTPSCGEITPTSPSTQCDGTVYMTPAHLRDTEQNGAYPGKYLGVFLREYARALQFTSGLSPLVGEVDSGSAEDLDKRLAQQATCLAGVASGALANRGAVDGNITGEISTRLTTVDAPPDAKAWLDKGFQARQPSACNTWN